MRLTAVPLMLLLNGCATLAVERYALGHPEQLEAASLEGARRLGWETRPLAPGKFRLVSPVFPIFPYRPQIDVTASDGVLTLEGIEIWKNADKPRPRGSNAGALLTEATLQVL